MKKMQIFEPAMCCPTGLCGVGVDPELLRISTVLNNLEKNGVKVERYNLSNSPQEFIKNKTVNAYIKANGAEGLPVILLDNEIIIHGRYPRNEEFIKFLEIPEEKLGDAQTVIHATEAKDGGCCCSDTDKAGDSSECCCSNTDEPDGSNDCCCSSTDEPDGSNDCCCSCCSDTDDGCCC